MNTQFLLILLICHFTFAHHHDEVDRDDTSTPGSLRFTVSKYYKYIEVLKMGLEPQWELLSSLTESIELQSKDLIALYSRDRAFENKYALLMKQKDDLVHMRHSCMCAGGTSHDTSEHCGGDTDTSTSCCKKHASGTCDDATHSHSSHCGGDTHTTTSCCKNSQCVKTLKDSIAQTEAELEEIQERIEDEDDGVHILDHMLEYTEAFHAFVQDAALMTFSMRRERIGQCELKLQELERLQNKATVANSDQSGLSEVLHQMCLQKPCPSLIHSKFGALRDLERMTKRTWYMKNVLISKWEPHLRNLLQHLSGLIRTLDPSWSPATEYTINSVIKTAQSLQINIPADAIDVDSIQESIMSELLDGQYGNFATQDTTSNFEKPIYSDLVELKIAYLFTEMQCVHHWNDVSSEVVSRQFDTFSIRKHNIRLHVGLVYDTTTLDSHSALHIFQNRVSQITNHQSEYFLFARSEYLQATTPHSLFQFITWMHAYTDELIARMTSSVLQGPDNITPITEALYIELYECVHQVYRRGESLSASDAKIVNARTQCGHIIRKIEKHETRFSLLVHKYSSATKKDSRDISLSIFSDLRTLFMLQFFIISEWVAGKKLEDIFKNLSLDLTTKLRKLHDDLSLPAPIFSDYQDKRTQEDEYIDEVFYSLSYNQRLLKLQNRAILERIGRDAYYLSVVESHKLLTIRAQAYRRDETQYVSRVGFIFMGKQERRKILLKYDDLLDIVSDRMKSAAPGHGPSSDNFQNVVLYLCGPSVDCPEDILKKLLDLRRLEIQYLHSRFVMHASTLSTNDLKLLLQFIDTLTRRLDALSSSSQGNVDKKYCAAVGEWIASVRPLIAARKERDTSTRAYEAVVSQKPPIEFLQLPNKGEIPQYSGHSSDVVADLMIARFHVEHLLAVREEPLPGETESEASYFENYHASKMFNVKNEIRMLKYALGIVHWGSLVKDNDELEKLQENLKSLVEAQGEYAYLLLHQNETHDVMVAKIDEDIRKLYAERATVQQNDQGDDLGVAYNQFEECKESSKSLSECQSACMPLVQPMIDKLKMYFAAKTYSFHTVFLRLHRIDIAIKELNILQHTVLHHAANGKIDQSNIDLIEEELFMLRDNIGLEGRSTTLSKPTSRISSLGVFFIVMSVLIAIGVIIGIIFYTHRRRANVNQKVYTEDFWNIGLSNQDNLL